MKGLTVILGKAKDKFGKMGEDEGMEDTDEEKLALCEDILSAIRSDNAEDLMLALEAWMSY